MTGRDRLIGLILGTALAGFSGCTLIGFGIGKMIDHDANRKGSLLPPLEMQRLQPGQAVKLFLRDGTRREGKFQGVVADSPSDYRTRYSVARAADGPSALPDIGQDVELTRRDGKARASTFVAFDPGSLIVRDAGGEREVVPFKDVVRVAWTEGATDGAALAEWAISGELPCLSRLLIDKERVLVESVVRLETRGGHAAVMGAVIGAVVDTLVIVAAVNSMNNDSWGSGDTTNTTSCPIVSTWDGEVYREEAQMYGGAILVSLARTDRAPLVHLRPRQGRLKLRVTNDRSEIEYVDRLALVEVDVPEGAEVATTPEGGLRVLRSLAPPVAAYDRQGRSVQAALVRSDEEEWTSDPLGLDPQREGTRDSLVLEFDCPAGAREATLLFRLRSTSWGSGLLGSLLRLQGRELDLFYARLDADAAKRQLFLEALAREGLPRIEVWDGGQWRPAGFLRNLGPLPRDQAIVVAAPPEAGGRLRARLTATAGLWSIDRAAADFGPVLSPSRRELPLLSAQTLEGKPVLDRLRAVDGQELVMPPWTSAVDLEFESGEPRAGQPVYAVEAHGHYRVLVPAEGAADRATFERLVSQPGAFGRWALLGLRREIMSRAGEAAASYLPPTVAAPAPTGK